MGCFENTKKLDLSHWRHQQVVINGRLHKGHRPLLYVTIRALGSLPSVALSSLMAGWLYVR